MADVTAAPLDKMDVSEPKQDQSKPEASGELEALLSSWATPLMDKMDLDAVSSDSDDDEHVHDHEKPHTHKKAEPTSEKPLVLVPDGGAVKVILKRGKGPMPPPGTEVEVHYTGALPDGTKFDSSLDRGETLKFKLGEGQMIKGFDKAVATMAKGERCRIALKPDYAYGVAGSPPKIPPNATLVFEIELVGWEEFKEITPGLKKQIIKAGEGYKTPAYESQVTYHMTLTSPDGLKTFHSTDGREPLKATIGMGVLPRGLERLLESMKKGEKARAKLGSNHAFGETGHPEFGVPANQELEGIFELVDFVKEKENWELSNFEEKLAVGVRRKNDGNEFFKQGQYKLALKKYKKAADLFSYDGSMSEEEKGRSRKEVKLPAHLNLAEVRLKLEQWKKAADAASKALEIEPGNIKGLYRRALALLGLQEFEKARKDLERALELDAENKPVKAALARVKAAQAEYDRKEQQRYRKMMEAFSKSEN